MYSTEDDKRPFATDIAHGPELQAYQSGAVSSFLGRLPEPCSDILEIGSDIECRVVSYLAEQTRASVVGINPASGFAASRSCLSNRLAAPHLVRGDGRYLPFAAESFDAILSIATLEHVHGVSEFLGDVARVLRPGGVFHTSFGPIWTCNVGHHVYAVVGNKEARFWKPGRNPLPDFAHLLMEPDEVRAHLRDGPCSEELIEPIIHWVYFGDGINRLAFSDYMRAFRTCPLKIQELRALLSSAVPSEAELQELRRRHGPNEDFRCSRFVVTLHKPVPPGTGSILSRRRVHMTKTRGPWYGALSRRLNGILLFRLATKMVSPRAWVKILRLAKKTMSGSAWTHVLYRLEDYLTK